MFLHHAGEDDIPVLFLPGNAGSFQQVRSLAGEAARQAFRRSREQGPATTGVRLVWLSVDFKEEHSALDGTILVRATGHPRQSMSASCMKIPTGFADSAHAS